MDWERLLSLKRFGDRERRIRNEQNETRLGFEVDYDRIIFSNSFRSLQDKTQVVPHSKEHFVHTRLTHSLEVSVVGRSLGRIIGKKILDQNPELKNKGYHFNDFGAIVASAALAHDIGNPPFGHSGEKAIGEFFKTDKGLKHKKELTEKEWQDLVDFEGNANGFRLLNGNKPGMDGGLRLSYATLGAFLKYPKESLPKTDSNSIYEKKYGVFQSDISIFNEIANELGLISTGKNGNISFKRHPLAYLVEAADDICYTIIDFEDGINLGLIEEDFALEYLIKLVKDSINSKKYHQLKYKKDRLSYLRALAIGTLINETTEVFLKNENAILNGEFETSLLKKCKYEAQLQDILKISTEKIYNSKDVVEKEILGYRIISKLLEVFIAAVNNNFHNCMTNYDKLILKILPEELKTQKKSLYLRVISVCDYVAGMTDGYALALYKKIIG